MSEVKKDVAGEWIKFKLTEALKKDPLYKDEEEKKAVMKDEEVDVHDGISDFLSRVLSKDDIKKLNYLNGFNPEREIHKELVPNPEKEKIKESVSMKEDGENNVENSSVANEDEASAVVNVNNAEEHSDEPATNLDATLDVTNVDDSEEGSVSEDEESEEKAVKNKGIGAFDRILEKCEKDEILSKAIAALNEPDIAEARKSFYSWFDSFDDEHVADEVPVEGDTESETSSDSENAEESDKPEETSAEDENNKVENEDKSDESDEEDSNSALDDLFA